MIGYSWTQVFKYGYASLILLDGKQCLRLVHMMSVNAEASQTLLMVRRPEGERVERLAKANGYRAEMSYFKPSILHCSSHSQVRPSGFPRDFFLVHRRGLEHRAGRHICFLLIAISLPLLIMNVYPDQPVCSFLVVQRSSPRLIKVRNPGFLGKGRKIIELI